MSAYQTLMERRDGGEDPLAVLREEMLREAGGDDDAVEVVPSIPFFLLMSC